MNKIIFSVLTFILFLSFQPINLVSAANENRVVDGVEAKKLDKRAEILAAYLTQYDSPLQYHAQDFIDAANQYNLDWRLVASIAGVESTFGKHIPGGFNGWGWGVYGTQAIFFNSWTEAIFTISKGLRENYINKGYTEPYSINKIYAASPTWGSRVSYFMQDLENFASKFPQDNIATSAAQISTDPKIAAVSASPVLR